MTEAENQKQKAIRLLARQLEELEFIRGLNWDNPKFKAWRDSTKGVLERSLGKNNHHTSRFFGTRFYGEFQSGCLVAHETLKAAIREVEDFGVYEEQTKPTINTKSGGVNQNFHGPVSIQNLAVAADNATQKIEQMGNKTGADLKAISDLLQQSEELSPRQVKEGLELIKAVAVEVSKPEAKRDWKSILEQGNAILKLANKATDLTDKLAHYTPAIIALMAQAKHFIK